MLILLAVLIAAAETPNTAMAIAVCDVGRMALRDIPLINNNRTFDAYYDDADPLLAMCPKLRDEIPAGYPLADGDARASERSCSNARPRRAAGVHLHDWRPPYLCRLAHGDCRTGIFLHGIMRGTFHRCLCTNRNGMAPIW
jgi:hypothetical protein